LKEIEQKKENERSWASFVVDQAKKYEKELREIGEAAFDFVSAEWSLCRWKASRRGGSAAILCVHDEPDMVVEKMRKMKEIRLQWSSSKF